MSKLHSGFALNVPYCSSSQLVSRSIKKLNCLRLI